MPHPEHAIFLDVLTRYYLVLDAFERLDVLRAFFVDEAVWECYAAGAAEPHLKFDPIDMFRTVAAREGDLARAAGTRHHLTGLSTVTTASGARSSIKVLVTVQPHRTKPPAILETAIVTCDWVKRGEDWKIAFWRIDRDSVDPQ
jgi:hypothetical protein